jgi:hypothetical protein
MANEVIIADTNLNCSILKKWVNFADRMLVDIEFEYMPIDRCTKSWVMDHMTNFDVPRSELARIADRMIPRYNKLVEDNITPNSFERLDRKPIKWDSTKQKAVIVDIDGTLSHIQTDRDTYDETRCQEDKFDEAVSSAALGVRTRINTAGYKRGYDGGIGAKFIVVSGRHEKAKDETLRWLGENGIMPDEIYFREDDDYRADFIVKNEFLRKISEFYYPVACFDDRKQVIEMQSKFLPEDCKIFRCGKVNEDDF